MRITAPVSSSTTTEPRFSPSASVPSSTMNEVGDQVFPDSVKEEVIVKEEKDNVENKVRNQFIAHLCLWNVLRL